MKSKLMEVGKMPEQIRAYEYEGDGYWGTLSLKGVDATTYIRLDIHDKALAAKDATIKDYKEVLASQRDEILVQDAEIEAIELDRDAKMKKVEHLQKEIQRLNREVQKWEEASGLAEAEGIAKDKEIERLRGEVNK
jgi:hypothetical protein